MGDDDKSSSSLSANTSRERRRQAAASRRAIRDGMNINGINNETVEAGRGDGDAVAASHLMPTTNTTTTTTTPPNRRRKPQQKHAAHPVQFNFLSNLSQALSNLDRHNRDYFSKPNDSDHDNVIKVEGGSMTKTNATSNHNVQRMTRMNKKKSSSSPFLPHNFSSYLNFNRLSLATLLLFTICYLLVIICCLPMITHSNDLESLPTVNDTIQRGASFQYIRGRKQFLKAKHSFADKLDKWREHAAMRIEKKGGDNNNSTANQDAMLEEEQLGLIDSIVRNDYVTKRDSLLLEQAVRDFEEKSSDVTKFDNIIGKRNAEPVHDHWKDAVDAWNKEFVQDANVVATNIIANEMGQTQNKKTPGFVVLGMHRSGTSMLSGLLVKGFGYETGGPLIGASFDNEKGFYERIDVVLQNDEFMAAQDAGWSWNVYYYDPQKALEHKAQGKVTFREGKRALQFLNNHQKTLPYLQKDPRMCITLRTWLKLLDDTPAVVFTYRHPLEVAMSLKHRKEGISIEHGLRLWIVYNMRGLQNSVGLCRVFSTNEAVFNDPKSEVQRIKNELTTKCNVIPPPIDEISSEVVNTFVDPKLQHNKKDKDAGKEQDHSVLKDFGNGCVAQDFKSEYEAESVNRRAEIEIYLMAMRVFCDLENGQAYKEDYEWPDLVHWQRPAKMS